MHFTTLYVLKGEKLEDWSREAIEESFAERYCYCCGETKPKYLMWCDWFQIGGRWPDIIEAKKGLHCESGWSNDNFEPEHGSYSVIDISELTEPLPRHNIYSVATKSRMYLKNDSWQVGGVVDKDKFNQLLDDIDNKKFVGIIALMDCHD